jgi:[acyl-carrier-protein] S-malonyltransferase
MGGDLTAALFSGPELGGGGPGPFVARCEPDIVVGHGLGDLAALAAADVVDVDDAVELARVRARARALALARVREQLIARASAEQAGGLLCVIAAADDAARHIAVLSGARIARQDSPRRVVLAGSHEQLAHARLAAEELCVSVADVPAPGALHSLAMTGAARRFAGAVAAVAFRDPTRIVYSAVTAAPVRNPRAELAACLHTPVRWRQTVRALAAAGITRYVEAGERRGLGDLVLETLGGSQLAQVRSELCPTS